MTPHFKATSMSNTQDTDRRAAINRTLLLLKYGPYEWTEKEKLDPEIMRATDSLMAEFQQHEQQAIKTALEPYRELIMAVGNKFDGETRHQTALRYIEQAEIGNDVPAEPDTLTMEQQS